MNGVLGCKKRGLSQFLLILVMEKKGNCGMKAQNQWSLTPLIAPVVMVQ